MPQPGRECRTIRAGCERVDVGGALAVQRSTSCPGLPPWRLARRPGCHMVRAMSIEKPLRELVQKELQGRLSPLLKAIARMNERLDTLDEVKNLLYGLEPMADRLMERERAARTGASQVAEEAEEAPIPPPRAARGGAARGGAARGRPAASSGERACAVIGCRRPARSKGYCSAHYQKLRLLVKSGRRPASWVDDAAPRSVPEIVLPRGRAASKARKEAPAPSRPEPKSPPKPKAWVRKKGAGERISLT